MKKPNITPGEWMQHEHAKGNVVSESRRLVASCMGFTTNQDDGEHIIESIANSELICKAGNLTNQGYNIEAIPELVEALRLAEMDIRLKLGYNNPVEVQSLEYIAEVIKKAKFE